MKLTVVMYHYVRDVLKTEFPKIKSITKKEFKYQIEYFKSKYNFIHYNDILECLYGGKKIKENSIYLTFDDGYSDHYSNVFPILKENNINASFFPISSSFKNKVNDTNKLHFILASIPSIDYIKKLILREIDDYKSRGFECGSYDKFYKKFAIKNQYDDKDTIFVKRLLQHSLPKDLRKKIIKRLFNEFVTTNEEKFSKKLFLTSTQLKEMKIME